MMHGCFKQAVHHSLWNMDLKRARTEDSEKTGLALLVSDSPQAGSIIVKHVVTRSDTVMISMKHVCTSAVWVHAGITTQEYAPVLPPNTSGMGHNQLESNGYANTHEARGRYMDGSEAYDQEEESGPSGYNPRGGTGRHGYSNGVNSYNSARQGGVHKFRQQADRLHLLQSHISCHAVFLHTLCV